MNIFNEINAVWSGDTVTVDKQPIEEERTVIPVIYLNEKDLHSCNDPKNCKLNTSLNPYWCSTKNDKGWETEDDNK